MIVGLRKVTSQRLAPAWGQRGLDGNDIILALSELLKIQFQTFDHFFKLIRFQLSFFSFIIDSKKINSFGFNVQVGDNSCTSTFTFSFTTYS